MGLFAQYKLSTLANTTVESWYHATEIILDLIITFNKMVATVVEHWPLYTIPMLRPSTTLCHLVYRWCASLYVTMLDDIDKGFCLFATRISSNMAKISLSFESHVSGCTSPILRPLATELKSPRISLIDVVKGWYCSILCKYYRIKHMIKTTSNLCKCNLHHGRQTQGQMKQRHSVQNINFTV